MGFEHGFEDDFLIIKVLYEHSGSWPQKCYDDRYLTGWLRHYIATRRYAFFNFRNTEACDGSRHRWGVSLVYWWHSTKQSPNLIFKGREGGREKFYKNNILSANLAEQQNPSELWTVVLGFIARRTSAGIASRKGCTTRQLSVAALSHE